MSIDMNNDSRHGTHDHGATPPGAPRHWRDTPLSRIPRGTPGGGRLGGVVAGASQAYGFDLRTTRIAVAIATIILPVLVAVYAVAWLLLPETPEQAMPIEQIVRDRRRMPLLAVVALVVVVGGVGSFGSWFFFRGAPWGLVLIGLGVLLWVTAGDHSTPAGPTTPAAWPTGGTSTATVTSSTGTTVSAFPSPAPAGGRVEGDPTPVGGIVIPVPDREGLADDAHPTPSSTPITGQVASPFGPPTVHDTAPVPQVSVGVPVPGRHHRVRRPRKPIGSIGVGIAVMWVAFAALAEAAGWWNAPALWVIVSAIGIVMTSLAVSAVVNRSWVLPVPFGMLAFVLIMLSIGRPNLDGPSGERTWLPTSVAEAEVHQHLAAGQLTLDLRDIPMSGEVHVSAEVGIGRLHVLVPKDVDLDLTTEVRGGQMQVDGRELSSGTNEVRTIQRDAIDTPAVGTITLDLEMGLGQIDVERVDG